MMIKDGSWVHDEKWCLQPASQSSNQAAKQPTNLATNEPSNQATKQTTDPATKHSSNRAQPDSSLVQVSAAQSSWDRMLKQQHGNAAANLGRATSAEQGGT